MALQIIGSGFGRTGTRSLKEALHILGFGPCHHMDEVLPSPEQRALWQGVLTGGHADWERIFSGYRAQIDWPGANFWRELAIAYPQATVIHSVRPEESWWKSYISTIGKLMAEFREMPLPSEISALMENLRSMVEKTFGSTVDDKAAGLAAYRRRGDQVRATIAPERLIVFDVAQGWEPLCSHLGVRRIPDQPFPRLNSTDDFWAALKGR